jgi:prevent-host-death family protein
VAFSLSQLLRAARAGKPITTTSHGEPVAELMAPATTARDAVERARAGRCRAGASCAPEVRQADRRRALDARRALRTRLSRRLALDTNVMVYADGVSRSPEDAAKCARALAIVERTAAETIVLPL